MFDDLRDLYQEVLLDHGKSPRNFRELDNATCHARGDNPMCGDRIEVFLAIGDDGVIEDMSFTGRGCAISVASASMMTEMLRGKTLEDAKRMFEGVHEMCTGGAADALAEIDEDAADRLRVLSGVREFPMRVKCATLAWHTMNAAVAGRGDVSTEDDKDV